jgi:hypothetical protein
MVILKDLTLYEEGLFAVFNIYENGDFEMK